MKTCAHCGVQNPDEAASCQTCHAVTFVSALPEAGGGHIISPAEQQFWRGITHRQFAVVLVRMQAIWFLFYTVYAMTSLPSYFPDFHEIFAANRLRPVMDTRAFMEVLRIVMNLAAGLACIQYADRIVSWLVRDMVSSGPPSPPTEPVSGEAVSSASRKEP